MDGQSGDFDHLNLVVDNATRWNSLYAMIERALKLRDRIDRFCIDEEHSMHGSRQAHERAQNEVDQTLLLKHDRLSRDDWLALTEVMNILQPFHTYTKRGEGTKLTADRGILSDYMTTLNKLLAHVRGVRDDLEARDNDPLTSSPSVQYLKTCAVNSWMKLDKYFALVDETPVVYASCVMNSIMKLKYFEYTWRNAHTWRDAVDPREWVPSTKAGILAVWDEYRNLPLPPHLKEAVEYIHEHDELEDAMDMTRLFAEEEWDELDVWLTAIPFQLLGKALPIYWLQQLENPTTYRLARMGIDMCSIPAMSSDCERVFSQCKLLITSQRNALQADIIEATQCLRMWLIMERKAVGKWHGRGNWQAPTAL